MMTVIFPHKTYSENKIKIKQIIKKYGMSWDDKKSGWVNEATGDGVYIDKSVMEMIMEDAFSANQPMTLYVESGNPDFIGEFEAKCSALGGQFIHGGATPVRPAEHKREAPGQTAPAQKAPERPGVQKDVFVRLGYRDITGSNTPGFKEKAYADLQDISARWERRKKQLLAEYAKMGLDEALADAILQREEIAFRKNNACWVTGEFPADRKQVD